MKMKQFFKYRTQQFLLKFNFLLVPDLYRNPQTLKKCIIHYVFNMQSKGI
jgi:hypothetical protein